MKIGFYSGSFDPPTKGHLWVAEEASAICDKFYMVVGPQPCKESLFTAPERVEMLSRILTRGTAELIITETNIVDFAKKRCGEDDQAFIFRGIRNTEDLEYESDICSLLYLYRKNLRIHPLFILPPTHLSEISSTSVKELCAQGDWEAVRRAVPPFVAEQLAKKYQKWVVIRPKPASIFEATTAGFCPSDDAPEHPAEKTRNFFNVLTKEGLVSLAQTITGDQVRATLDPFPVDVVISENFQLMEIPVNCVQPIGGRYLSHSYSIGPIVVDVNRDLSSELLYQNKLGSVIVIEGKHRWLDAKHRGDRTIHAWVGDLAIKELRSKGKI